MKNKYTTPQLLVSEILIETGFATSQGGGRLQRLGRHRENDS